MMRRIQTIRRKSMWFIITLTLALAFVLSACGSSTGTVTGAAPGTPTNTPQPTTVKGYGTQYGCPNDIVVTTAPAAANVVVSLSDAHHVIAAHMGDVIEFKLPFGQRWRGPSASQGVLQLQTPSGYVWKADNSCIWRFVAQGKGTTQISFEAMAVCKMGQMCPQYIVSMSFTVSVK